MMYSFFSVVQAQSLLKREAPQCQGFAACTKLFFNNLWTTLTGNPTPSSTAQTLPSGGNPVQQDTKLIKVGTTEKLLRVDPVYTPSKDSTGKSLILQPLGRDNVVVGSGSGARDEDRMYKLYVNGWTYAQQFKGNGLELSGSAMVKNLFSESSINAPVIYTQEFCLDTCVKKIEDFGPWKVVDGVLSYDINNVKIKKDLVVEGDISAKDASFSNSLTTKTLDVTGVSNLAGTVNILSPRDRAALNVQGTVIANKFCFQAFGCKDNWDDIGLWKKISTDNADISYMGGRVSICSGKEKECSPADGFALTVLGSTSTGVLEANSGLFQGIRLPIAPPPLLTLAAGNGGTAALDIGGTPKQSVSDDDNYRYWRISQDNDTSNNYKAGRLRIWPIINNGETIDIEEKSGAGNSSGITILRNGHVGIGTQNPDLGGSFMLAVAGDVNLITPKTALSDAKNRVALAHDRIGLDIAEVYQTDGDVEVGDVVVAGHADRILQKSSKPYQADIIGIVSGSPALLFEGSEMKIGGTPDRFIKGTKPPIALAGRVPVKVSMENGPVKVGDYLTSSSAPGIAMRATEPGTALGVALEAYSGPANGLVLAFVNIGERNVAGRLRELEQQINAMKKGEK